MTVTELDIKRQLCLRSYRYYANEFWDEAPGAQPVQWNWHMFEIIDELQFLLDGIIAGRPRDHDTILNVSPGTSKSTLASILLTGWGWARAPWLRFINMSHTDNLVLDLANKARAVITSEKYQLYFPYVKMSPTQDTKGYFANTMGGDRFSCTVGGKAATGHHAHLCVGDDLIDPMKALSELELKTSNDTWDQILSRRILPTGTQTEMVSAVLLLMQRVHQDDPSNRMLSWGDDGATKIKRICIPAELSEDVFPTHLREKYVDGLMDPRRLSRKHLAEQLKRLGQYGYAAQYMQNPIPAGGGMFHVDDCRKGFQVPTQWKYVLRYWDKAGCLSPGTLITTRDGQVPIEQVNAGDIVLTRDGWREVEWAGKTGDVEEVTTATFADGRTLSGTWDHPVWTENRGWVKLQNLHERDVIVPVNEEAVRETLKPKSLSLMVSSTDALQDVGTSRRCDGTKSINDTTTKLFTKRFGKRTRDRSPLAITSITKMAIGTTTPSTIWSVSTAAPTIENIQRASVLQNYLDISSQFSRRGLRQRIEDGRLRLTTNINADAVARHLKAGAWIENYLATAPSVVQPMPTTNGVVPVYDLTVKGKHEFYANGILVHNTHAGGNFTVGTKMGMDKDDRIWILDVIRGQWDSFRREQIIQSTAAKDGHSCFVIFEQEPGSGGKESAEASVRRLQGYRIRVHKVGASDGSKVTRADPFSVQMNMGNVYLAPGDWHKDWIEEFRHFPNSKYKDQVDSGSGGYLFLSRKRIEIGAMK
jgi:predicted phage terminase large subunit-like protein